MSPSEGARGAELPEGRVAQLTSHARPAQAIRGASAVTRGPGSVCVSAHTCAHGPGPPSGTADHVTPAVNRRGGPGPCHGPCLGALRPTARGDPCVLWRLNILHLDHEASAQRGQEAASEGTPTCRAMVGGPKVRRPGRWMQTGTQRGARSQEERRLTTGAPHATASTERPQLPGAETRGL
uniref:Uncharacterized protein n=1 Tax=Rangifer tarandus platyrhynchus TaxID=3082113 RepID=A0ACB0FDQ5_RANTA|nr:unnamed protein product [Rangifer tarandus platyrhynchus]